MPPRGGVRPRHRGRRPDRANDGKGQDRHRKSLGPRGQVYFQGSGCVGGGALKALSPSGERVGRGGRMRDRRLIEFAKQMRREQTEPENRLWLELSGQRFQRLKFRRQQVNVPYNADLLSRKPTLEIEIDGEPT